MYDDVDEEEENFSLPVKMYSSADNLCKLCIGSGFFWSGGEVEDDDFIPPSLFRICIPCLYG